MANMGIDKNSAHDRLLLLRILSFQQKSVQLLIYKSNRILLSSIMLHWMYVTIHMQHFLRRLFHFIRVKVLNKWAK